MNESALLPSLPSTGVRPTALPIFAASVTIVLWASAFVGVRIAGDGYSPGALAFGRQLVGAAMLTVFVVVRAARTRQAIRLPRGRVAFAVLAWGGAWFGFYNLALNFAEQHLDAGTTSFLVNLAPVLIGVLAATFLGEALTPRLVIGLGVSLTGVAVIAVSNGSGRGDLVGVIAGLAAAILYAGSATAQKRLLVQVDPLLLTWLGCVGGVVVCAPFAGGLFHEVMTASPRATWSVVYLGVFPTAVAFVTWGYALARSRVGGLAAVTYVIPALVVALSWLLLGEVPGVVTLVGGALCLAGVGFAMRRRLRQPPAVAQRDG
ncbi:DMT family transporter [Leifsonia sp. EB34]|uniref:DMT family transporter n=1 Tax=Leifsonia sp. EB34 TaxID=3156303 RepID=UPI0035122267